ncbi:DUF374 domain-containing protein [bacterium]|nr:DUF374 domain-containing protein [bacterium]
MGLQGLKLLLAPPAWRGLAASLRLAGPPVPAGGGPRIFACLHRDILGAILHVAPARPTLLVSSSPDGDILIRTLGTACYGYVRGATGDNGARAFVALRRELEAGRSIGVAVDGPKGPFGVIHDGGLQLARLTGAPLAPLRMAAARARVLATWDRTVVPLPFSRVRIDAGPELRVADDGASVAAARAELAAFFGVEEENRADP